MTTGRINQIATLFPWHDGIPQTSLRWSQIWKITSTLVLAQDRFIAASSNTSINTTFECYKRLTWHNPWRTNNRKISSNQKPMLFSLPSHTTKSHGSLTSCRRNDYKVKPSTFHRTEPTQATCVLLLSNAYLPTNFHFLCIKWNVHFLLRPKAVIINYPDLTATMPSATEHYFYPVLPRSRRVK